VRNGSATALRLVCDQGVGRSRRSPVLSGATHHETDPLGGLSSAGVVVDRRNCGSGNGSSQVGLPGERQVHSKASGRFSGVISGSVSNPVVTGTLGGSWASLDAPVINGSGSGSSRVRAGLHIIRASCTAISGDAVAMFAEFAAPVAQYISISGSGVWTAART
jgi:hypothetical protein